MATDAETSALRVMALILAMAPCTHACNCAVPPLLLVHVCTPGLPDTPSLSEPLGLEALPLSYHFIENDMCQSTSLDYMELTVTTNYQNKEVSRLFFNPLKKS
jgi:hypothetical protein